ncbi:MAG: response regulator transcription factor [Thermovirgaceae bacterium]|nr:response regulator transcription factor [Thermovirgaceae bacterium]
MDKTRVLLTIQHRLVREALGKAIGQEDDMYVVAAADDGLEAFRLAREQRPDVVLFDIDSGKTDWAHFVRELAVSCRGIRFMALSANGHTEKISDLCEAGIHGCVSLSSSFSDLIKGLRNVSGGGLYFDDRISAELPEVLSKINEGALLIRLLTAREKEVVYLVSQGFSNQQIAKEMVLSEKTVKNHISHILRKLELKDRTQVAILAWKTGLAGNDSKTFRRD